jgi:sortase A
MRLRRGGAARYPATPMDRPLAYRPSREDGDDGQWSFRMAEPNEPTYVKATGIAGKTLIIAGLLVLGLVAYQLWGTGIQTAQAQSRLRNEFDEKRALVAVTPLPPSTAPITTVPPASTAPSDAAVATPAPTVAPTTPAPTPPAIDLSTIQEGEAIGRVVIPKIGVDEIIVAGVGREDLKKGPGHFPGTPFPGQSGNAAIAGHRTTFGAPFRDLDQLAVGDRIEVETLIGKYTYEVFEFPAAIEPTDVDRVIGGSPFAQLTLMACHPPYSARQRIIVKAVLVPEASSAPTEATPNVYSDDDGVSGLEDEPVDPAVTDPSATVAFGDDPAGSPSTPAPSPQLAGSDGIAAAAGRAADDFNAGWFSDSSAFVPTALFALVCLAIGIGASALVRRTGRKLLYIPAAPVFLVGLYFFYENVSRILPASY